MVNANVRQSGSAFTDVLQERDLVGTAAIMALLTGGLFVAQEVSDLVLPRLNMSMDPSTPRELGAAMLIKLVTAALFVAVSMRVGRMGRTVIGVMAGGMLASAGLDFVDILQRSAPEASSPTSSAPSPTVKPSPSQGRQVRRVSSGGGVGATAEGLR